MLPFVDAPAYLVKACMLFDRDACRCEGLNGLKGALQVGYIHLLNTHMPVGFVKQPALQFPVGIQLAVHTSSLYNALLVEIGFTMPNQVNMLFQVNVLPVN